MRSYYLLPGLLTGLAGLGLVVSLNGQPPAGPPRVVVKPVIQKDIAAGQSFVGTVMPKRTSVIGSAVNGRMEELYVNEGDRIEAKKPIAKLRTGIIDAELAAAKAELDVRKAERDEIIAGWRPEEIEQAKARLKLAEAVREMRRANLERSKAAGKVISPEDHDLALSLAAQSEAAWIDAKETLELVKKGHRDEKKAQAEAKVRSLAAEVRRLEEMQARHTVYAPFTGYITAEHCDVGQWLNQGMPIVEIAELDEVDVQVEVLEDHIANLAIGSAARVEVNALPNEKLIGEVVLIVPKANVQARTFPVKVRIKNRLENNQPVLKAGMFARVHLTVGKKEAMLLVPQDALVLGGPSPVIFVATPDAADAKQGKVRPVVVQLGVADGHLVQVKGDVKPNELVVSQGNERLRPGQEVQW